MKKIAILLLSSVLLVGCSSAKVVTEPACTDILTEVVDAVITKTHRYPSGGRFDIECDGIFATFHDDTIWRARDVGDTIKVKKKVYMLNNSIEKIELELLN